MEDGQNILQLAMPLNADCCFTSALWLITLMWNDIFLDAVTNLKEREIF